MRVLLAFNFVQFKLIPLLPVRLSQSATTYSILLPTFVLSRTFILTKNELAHFSSFVLNTFVSIFTAITKLTTEKSEKGKTQLIY